jgi:hypothetical protein
MTESNNTQQGPFDDAPIIYKYTRKQALDDGVLVDLTSWAQETGFRIPVACTHAVWQDYVEPPDGTEAAGQSARGRAHDLLWMLYVAIKRQPESSQRLGYEVIFLNAELEQETVQLHAVCGPGDADEPVLTIMLPHED